MSRSGKNNKNVGALSRYPMESESDSDDGIILNEVQTVSIEEMFVKHFCCVESTLSQQTTKILRKLQAAVESLHVGIKRNGSTTSSKFPIYDKEDQEITVTGSRYRKDI